MKKNNEKGIKGDKRIYYSFLCCKESLESFKIEKKNKEKELNELMESSKENSNFCGVAFVTFNTIKEQEDYLHKLKKLFYCFGDKHIDSLNSYEKTIIIQRAPEPEDIIFENFDTTFKTRFQSITYNSDFFILLLILCVTFGINLISYFFQSKIDKSSSKTIILYVFSFILTIANAINDFIFEIILEKFTKIFKFFTFTYFYLNYSLGLSFYSIINSFFIPALFEIYYKTEEHEILTSNLIIKFLFNSFVTPIMWTINLKFAYKKFKQCIIEQKEKINYNQKELNELYELQSMNVERKYSYIIKTLFMSSFFTPVFPLGFCISLIGFIFGYWLEKYNLSKMYKKPEKLDKQIAEFYVKSFCSLFFSFICGNFCFIYFGSAELVIYSSWYFVCILGQSLFTPFLNCFQRDYLGIKKSAIHKKTHDEMYFDFTTDYERAYLDKLEEKNKINKIEKDKRKKKMKEENQIKFYLRKQRLSRIINSKELNNLLNLDDDNQEKEKDNICNIIPEINVCEEEKKSKTGRAGKINFNNKSNISMKFIMNKGKANKI